MSINAIVPQDGETGFLNVLIADVLTGANLHLFSNNVTVDATSALTDFTECTFAGYAEQPLDTWSIPVIEGDGSSGSSPADVTFTPTSSLGSGAIYGGYVTDSTDTVLLWAWNFPTGGITVAQGITLDLSNLFTVLSRY